MRRSHSVVFALFLGGGLLALLLTPCGYELTAFGRAEQPSAPAGDVAPRVRDVRVLIADDVEGFRLRTDGPLRVLRDRAGTGIQLPAGKWIDVRRDETGGIRVGDDATSALRVTLSGEPAGVVWVAFDRAGESSTEVSYPGTLHVGGGDNGGIDVINEVDIERYVACVVANEVWPNFDTEAFRVQAIVVRTFALYQMNRRTTATFDVSATQGSQVYRGLRTDATGRRAQEAAEYTRGVVCTWSDRGEERLFCTYYSAACGGISQPAAPFGAEGDIVPLAGGVKCDFCRIAPGDAYRWGPARLSLDDVLTRLVARYPDWQSLERITSISVIERTPSGRPVSLRVTGSNGRPQDILAERFRLAVGPNLMRSTDCKIRVSAGEAIIENGKGFGHGLGLCQWGAQGQAAAGKEAGEILRFYYPGTKLTRVY